MGLVWFFHRRDTEAQRIYQSILKNPLCLCASVVIVIGEQYDS